MYYHWMEGYILGVIGNDGNDGTCMEKWLRRHQAHFMLSCDALRLIRDNELYKLYCNLMQALNIQNV